MTNETFPVLPLRSIVPFPGSVLPLEVGRTRSIQAVDVANSDDRQLLLVPQRDPEQANPSENDLLDIGVQAEIIELIPHEHQRYTVIVRAVERYHVDDFVSGLSYLAAEVTPFEADHATPEAIAPLVQEMRSYLTTVLRNVADSEVSADIGFVEEPDELINLAVAHVELPRDEAIEILSESDPLTRLELLLPRVRRAGEVLRVKDSIRNELMEKVTLEQRERVLRERKRSIQEELGESGDEVDELADRVDESKLSDEAREASQKELRRMRDMDTSSPQYSTARTYVESLLDLPWGEYSADTMDVAAARAILEAEHSGLAKVKKRILEFIAVRKLVPDRQSGTILCLAGPPGVGKTSLGRSIANALNRKYVRMALGGVRDEAEVRGHRRTYIGAMPGRIASCLKKAGTMNPVFVLDEIDKLGSDHRGDPSSALLEVLDPEQNVDFSDHYLGVPLDLSKVMFLATANDLSTIPHALRDRLEIIQVPGYTELEKFEIAQTHLLPKQMAEHGLERDGLQITDAALETLIAGYTREGGVRNLEREISALCRATAVQVASNRTAKLTYDLEDLEEILGPRKFFREIGVRVDMIGVVTGLVWTPVGGDIQFIEVRTMPGKGKFKVTGQLGDVMQESVQAALSWVRSHAEDFGIEHSLFEKSDIHVHAPSGAIKKDGPSAGVAIATALVSRFTSTPIRHDVAITGEITLRGRVLPVGGIKSKVLAAHRSGVKTLVLPKRNENDLEEIPAHVRDNIEVRFVERVEEAMQTALSQNVGIGGSGVDVPAELLETAIGEETAPNLES